GRIAQREPQPVDGGIEAAFEVDKGVFRPEPPMQLFPSDHCAWFFEQGAQDLQRLRLQLDADALFPQFPGIDFELEYSEPDELPRAFPCDLGRLLRGGGHLSDPLLSEHSIALWD